MLTIKQAMHATTKQTKRFIMFTKILSSSISRHLICKLDRHFPCSLMCTNMCGGPEEQLWCWQTDGNLLGGCICERTPKKENKLCMFPPLLQLRPWRNTEDHFKTCHKIRWHGLLVQICNEQRRSGGRYRVILQVRCGHTGHREYFHFWWWDAEFRHLLWVYYCGR